MKIEKVCSEQPSEMPTECFIKDCPNHSDMLVNGLRFLEFPQNPIKNAVWMDSIRLHYSDHPTPQLLSRICNGHFFLKNSDTFNPEHPSYKPIFFPVMTKEEIKDLRMSCKERVHLFQDTIVKKEVIESSMSSSLRTFDTSDENVPPKKSKRHIPPKPYRKVISKHSYCCVVGCYNNTNDNDVEFIKFPNRVSQQYRAWIRRIGRVNSDGSLWLPSSDSLICSDHFYDGSLSDMDSIFSTSFAPAFFPHNIDKWEDIRHTLSMRKENGKPTYVSHEPDGDNYVGSNSVSLDLDDYSFSNEKVTLIYPSWMNEISEYVLECQQGKKFTDVIISNGQHSFEGHRIIIMSALPMIKMALLNLECCELDEKPVIILPDMSAYEIEILEKVIYSRGSLSASQYTFSKQNGEDFSYHTTNVKISEQCPISEAVAEKVKKAAGDKKQILAPIPVLKLDNKKITSNDFFRLYNNVACRAAKNHALHHTFQPKPNSIAQSNEIEDSILGDEIFDKEVVQEVTPSSSVHTDSTPIEEKDKPILDKIMKQVTTMRAVNPRKFTVRNANKKYTVIMQTVKRPDASAKPFPSLEEIKARRSERPTKPYCSACEKEFDTYTERDQHKVFHLSDPDQFPNSLNCKYCKKNLKTVEQKRIHETNHTKVGWKCEICEKGFPSAHKLLDHSFTHKTTSRFMCQFCSKGFRIKSKLILHENMHRNISKHKCKYCLRLFISSRSLLDHLNFHEGIRPYVCDKCGKSFCTSPSLSQHRSRVHNRCDFALGSYKCKHCFKRFRYKAVANNHMEHCDSRPPVTVLHIENA
uniref:Uncharacterized protein n=1 Tax=Lepeophtheirus salmonis TaxID=72036 RepID=A0A0K2SV22_LEPSM